MVQVGDVIVSMSIFKDKFCCDIDQCKGMCCVDGDSGAPIEEEEKKKLEEVLPFVWNDLSEKAQSLIKKQGVTFIDCEGDMVTSIVDKKDCVFTCYDERGCCCCAIEKAYRAGEIDFYKPISCHLYPIRLSKIGDYQALNYDKWDICKAALVLGETSNITVYEFLKIPLIRKFGEKWYGELEKVSEELKKQNIL